MLSDVPTFQRLSVAACEQVAAQLEAVELAGGRVIVTAGLPGDSLFFVEEGQARAGTDGSGQLYVKGQWFNEQALLGDAPSPLTIVADGDALRCLKVSRSVYTAAIESTSTTASASPELQMLQPEPELHRYARKAPEHAIPRGLEIEFGDLKIQKRIGAGAAGVVHRATHRGQDVAVKIFSAQDAMSEDEMKDFRAEVKWLSTLRCSYIVLLVGVCTVVPNMCVVTEYLPRGSVYDLIHRQKTEIGFARRMRMLLDVIKGMQYLESMAVVHRDLKSQNLLVDRAWRVKIADFGLARLLQSSNLQTVTSGAGTPNWMAPEVLNELEITSKADVYSFGVVVWEMVVRQVPWNGRNISQIVMGVGIRGDRLPVDIPAMVDHPELQNLCTSCFEVAPGARPSFEALCATFSAYMQRLMGGQGQQKATVQPQTAAEEGIPPSTSAARQAEPTIDSRAAGESSSSLDDITKSRPSSPSTSSVASWSTEHVGSWLSSKGLSESIVETFRTHQVTGLHLLEISKKACQLFCTAKLYLILLLLCRKSRKTWALQHLQTSKR